MNRTIRQLQEIWGENNNTLQFSSFFANNLSLLFITFEQLTSMDLEENPIIDDDDDKNFTAVTD